MSLTARVLDELAVAKFDLSPREEKALSAPHREAVALVEEHLRDLLDGFREQARTLLLFELYRVSAEHTGQEWAPRMEYGVWEALHHGAERLSDAEVRKLARLSQHAGGWYHYPSEAPGPVFVTLEKWETLYDMHNAYHTQIRRSELT